MAEWIGPNQEQRCQRCGEPITFDYTSVVGPENDNDDPVMRFNFSCSTDPMCYDVSFTTAKKVDPPDDWLPETFMESLEVRSI